jgi:hypothetical protein
MEGRTGMDWPRLLAYITGTVDQELLLRNEYLAAENRILKAQIKGRLHLSDAERTTLVKLVIGWAESRLRILRSRPNPIRFWAGIGN